ncbi:MAG: RNA polymerase sigma factor [Robiginitomaculum sp.]|nr:RNA polymerase sigma factor [Robiginitomaculum sp.]
MVDDVTSQDEQYKMAATEFGDAIGRLAYAYERDPDKRKDLVQDIHFELWRSFKIFDGRSSVRTWVYRVAHNAGASHIMKNKRVSQNTHLTLDDIGEIPDQTNYVDVFERIDQLDQLMTLIQRLNPADRQIITLYLEGLDAAAIGDISGISSGAVATKIHRIKYKLSELFSKGETHVHKRSKSKGLMAKPSI